MNIRLNRRDPRDKGLIGCGWPATVELLLVPDLAVDSGGCEQSPFIPSGLFFNSEFFAFDEILALAGRRESNTLDRIRRQIHPPVPSAILKYP